MIALYEFLMFFSLPKTILVNFFVQFSHLQYKLVWVLCLKKISRKIFFLKGLNFKLQRNGNSNSISSSDKKRSEVGYLTKIVLLR